MAKRPAEFYGISVHENNLRELKARCRSEECPFLGRRCVKQRKSDPEQTIGSCSLGFQDKALIVCPCRFLERDQIFLDTLRLLRPRQRYFAVPEISMPGGNVDYFVVAREGSDIVDYVGVEIQSLDTTGSGGIWQAREDIVAGRLGTNYGYGINWKMSAKTILVQMHHKAMSFETLRKKLVLVVQAEFFTYMAREFRTGHLQAADDRDSVHFHIYDFVEMGGARRIVLHDRKSTDVHGIEDMLALSERPEITDADVIKAIQAKMKNARPLQAPA